MGQRIIQVDAFTARPFAGNPAAVCVLPEARDSVWMQQVASEMNLAETAFLTRLTKSETGTENTGDFHLRWFTPTVEVDLCGHATLASAHVLWEEGHLARTEPARFHTRNGLLTAVCNDGTKEGIIELDFPAEPAEPVATADIPPNLIEALGITPLFIGRNRMDYLVEIDGEDTLHGLKPDIGKLGKIAARGIIITSRADTASDNATGSRVFDFVSRFFAPSVGVDEDPVTGSAHCCLGPYWQQRLGKSEFTAYQASSRGGIVQVRMEGDRVKLGGQAVTVLRGELSDIAS